MHASSGRSRPHRFAVLLALVALTAPALAVAPSALGGGRLAGAQAADALPHAPANGPVVRGFEEPAGRFDPGHRGLDIAVPFGTAVHAAADGTVVFAGMVAGSRFVTIAHPALSHDGQLETTYSFLSRVDTRLGSVVHAGDVIGASGAGHPGSTVAALHFGVRRDGRYVDPAPLLHLSHSQDDVSDLVSLGPLPAPRANLASVPRTPGTPGPARHAARPASESSPGETRRVASAGRPITLHDAGRAATVKRGLPGSLRGLLRAVLRGLKRHPGRSRGSGPEPVG